MATLSKYGIFIYLSQTKSLTKTYNVFPYFLVFNEKERERSGTSFLDAIIYTVLQFHRNVFVGGTLEVPLSYDSTSCNLGLNLKDLYTIRAFGAHCSRFALAAYSEKL